MFHHFVIGIFAVAGLPPDEEQAIEREARLDVILRLALARSPDMSESRKRVDAARERSSAAGRLPDLELKYEQWGVPLAKPWALDKADTLMLGLRQTFPAPGSLDARSRAAVEDASVIAQSERMRAQEIVTAVRRAYASYFRAEQTYRIHLEHVEIASNLLDLARANYAAGKSTQSDVLRAMVELSRLHRDLSAIEQERTSSRALINAIIDRPPAAKLGPPSELDPPPEKIDVEQLEQRLEANRPELLSAKHAIARTEAELEGRKRTAMWPSFMVGVDYWFMPANPETKHAYGAMVSINLPWLNGRHSDDISEAEQTLAAERSALRSAENTALYQLHDALARLKAGEESLAVIDRDLLPQAQESFEAARGAFAAGQGDALGLLDAMRSMLDVRLERVRTRSEIASTYADIERFAGVADVAGEGDRHE